MDFINLTPHSVDILDPDEGLVRTVEPSGTIARVRQEWVEQGRVDGIPVYTVKPTHVDNLPDPRPQTIFVASAYVESFVEGRPDVYSPGRKQRDQDGQVYGCVGLKQTD